MPSVRRGQADCRPHREAYYTDKHGQKSVHDYIYRKAASTQQHLVSRTNRSQQNQATPKAHYRRSSLRPYLSSSLTLPLGPLILPLNPPMPPIPPLIPLIPPLDPLMLPPIPPIPPPIPPIRLPDEPPIPLIGLGPLIPPIGLGPPIPLPPLSPPPPPAGPPGPAAPPLPWILVTAMNASKSVGTTNG